MSNRWEVPYTAPGIKHGRLVVVATNRETAILAAVDAHGRRTKRIPTTTGDRRRLTLTTRERAAIDYGEPRPLGGDVA